MACWLPAYSSRSLRGLLRFLAESGRIMRDYDDMTARMFGIDIATDPPQFAFHDAMRRAIDPLP